jgi:hypothetical protein
MRASPKECREHADHCRLMMAKSPSALAKEFERLAEEWTRLAKDLERAEAFRPDLAPPLVGNLNIA